MLSVSKSLLRFEFINLKLSVMTGATCTLNNKQTVPTNHVEYTECTRIVRDSSLPPQSSVDDMRESLLSCHLQSAI